MAHKYYESSRKYYEEHRLEIIEQKKKTNKEFRQKNPEKYMVTAAKRRAKVKGWEFNITHKDVKIPKFCPYLGIELKYLGGDSSPSLDRIDPLKGYVKGNVQVISMKANTMKSSATQDELVRFAEAVLKMDTGRKAASAALIEVTMEEL
jgi:hypothetical protein